ncbi:hypothetical protein BP5796_11754 [Coleophoma crateriformis]|uniref:CCAAT-binding factor domain-containing protein n=1 Tax=Coleophoma crateriformis TaxID=565419 RepID=A0A3D8QES4_9HELO|nr:hypothetical protein BP5796_11754 [Coleophoma crateriformis]
MPGIVSKTGHSVKRKRDTTEKRPSKRARSESSDDEDTQAEILLLENEIFESNSKKNYNNIAKLIQILNNDGDDADDSFLAAISLCRVFTKLIAAGELERKQGNSEKDAVVMRWLKERYAQYKEGLLGLLGQEGVGVPVLTLCMKLLKTEGQYLLNGQDYNFPVGFLTEIVQILLDAECDTAVREDFSRKWVEEYDDIRYYTFQIIAETLQDDDMQDMREGMLGSALDILTAVESVPESKDELEDFHVEAPKKKNHALYSLTQHKKRAQEAWLAVMKLQMNKEQRKTMLGLITDSIAPWFVKPELLMDFLTDSYNAGGSTSLLSLSGVFYLIQEKNLDYPSFYKKLYSLLDSGILHSKHRSRFFRLLDTFLASSHLPAVLVASFIKRLSRLTLNAPPGGIVAVVPWIYNLLKKHPTCTFMIHRETRTAEGKKILEDEGMDDPFDMEEEDPMETNAIESSLWEIALLQSHYHPNVATLAKIISEQFTKQSYNMEDFLDLAYGSLLETELGKDVKKAPIVEYEIPKKIFMKQDAESGFEDTLLVKLWEFK